MPKESNARRGFLELDGYARLASACTKVGLWLRALLETAYTFGFRLGELRSMRCRQVNLLAGTIALETSKNDEPREVYMTAGVRELLTGLVVGRKRDDFVFTRDGSPLGDFRKRWANVCVAAGVGAFHCPLCNEVVTVGTDDAPYVHSGREWGRSQLKYRGLIFHDLRRRAVRGLIRGSAEDRNVHHRA